VEAKECNEGSGYTECCCSDFTVRYYPNDSDKAKYKKICLVTYAISKMKRLYCPIDRAIESFHNPTWHYDKPLEAQTCWVAGNPKTMKQSKLYARWTDNPGFGPSSGEQMCFPYCLLKDLAQSFEVCAVGTTINGTKEVVGCVFYTHACTVTYTPATVNGDMGLAGISGLCRCNVDCNIGRTGDIGNNVAPKESTNVPNPYTGTHPDHDEIAPNGWW
jgi:hypothetical protein